MTKDEGYLTPAQLEAMGADAMADLLRRHSGDPNFHWQVREAVLNRAAEILAQRTVEPPAELRARVIGIDGTEEWITINQGAAEPTCQCKYAGVGQHHPECPAANRGAE